ncbi:MAG TPA: hypothetical protein VJ436_12370, partial [Anaerolineales bacterium]|nr:hypothetical protein [Anaerolineales bacterium]
MKEEPTVLDYLKALLTPWRGARPRIPGEATTAEQEAPQPFTPDGNVYRASEENGLAAVEVVTPELSHKAVLELDQTATRPHGEVKEPVGAPGPVGLPWRALIALGLVLLAQRAFEPGSGRTWEVGAGLYLIAAAWLVFAHWRNEWQLAPLPAMEESRRDPMTVHSVPLWAGAISAILAFLTFGGNKFNSLNLFFWAISILQFLLAFWLPGSPALSWTSRLSKYLKQPRLSLRLSRGSLLVLAAVLLVFFFRLYRLADVPPEMISDHAEKLQDIWDVLHGETH